MKYEHGWVATKEAEENCVYLCMSKLTGGLFVFVVHICMQGSVGEVKGVSTGSLMRSSNLKKWFTASRFFIFMHLGKNNTSTLYLLRRTVEFVVCGNEEGALVAGRDARRAAGAVWRGCATAYHWACRCHRAPRDPGEIRELSPWDGQPCPPKWDESRSKWSGQCCTIDYQYEMSDSPFWRRNPSLHAHIL